jgi:sporulation protein YlmC with PRC-barrel domain
MADGFEFVIGAEVRCSGGGVCGKVERLVVDPRARTVTNLVVRVKHRRILDRLVPVGLVEAAEGGSGVRLGCSVDDFDKLDPAEEKHRVTEGSSFGYFVAHATGPGPAVTPAVGRPEVVTDETVPFGEVDVHGGDTVRASDGEIGHVEGLVADPDDHAVTHVLLEVGRLPLGRKHVAIPIDTVASVAAGLEVNLTKQQVHDL